METAELNSLSIPAPQQAPVNQPTGRNPHLEVLHLRPSKGWRIARLIEVWRCRELLVFLAWRDIKVRYKQTVFGAAWAILQPLLMMLAFSVFFRRMAGIASDGTPYPLFVYAGLLPWTFFATAVNGAGNSVVSSERLVTKIYFPRLLIPLASISTAAVDFCVAMGLMAILMFHYHIWGGHQMLLAPIIMLFIGASAAGIGTGIAAMTVRYRDVKYVLPFMLQFWMFATPSVYMPTGVQKMVGLKLILAANPMTALIGAFRAACLGGPIPWSSAVPAACFGVLLLFAGCLYFQKIEDRFADEI